MPLELVAIAVDMAASAHRHGVTSFVVAYKYYPPFDGIAAGWWLSLERS